jgi:serine/threonine protein kinase
MEVSLQSFRKRFTYDPAKDLLGKGGFGEVYKAYDNEDHHFVALKISQGTADDKYNLISEIKRFKKLNHPNIVKHIEAYEVNTGSTDIHGKPILYHVGILEYADKGTLADLLKKGTPDYRLIEDLAKDIIEGLAYLHKENIIHRDLKPTNILLFSEGEKLRAKITDFGIAKRADATAVSTQLVGTVEYMAPEYFTTGNITPASDVWSLGVMLLEALTGTHPFGKTSQGIGNEQIIANILNKDLTTATQNLTEPLKKIITDCLRREPELRPQTAEALKAELTNLGADSFGEKTQVIQLKKPSTTNQNAEPKWKKWGKVLFDFDLRKGRLKKVVAKELLIFCLLSVGFALSFGLVYKYFDRYCEYEIKSLWASGNKISGELKQIHSINPLLSKISNYGGVFYMSGSDVNEKHCLNPMELNRVFFPSSNLNNFDVDSGQITLVLIDFDLNSFYEKAVYNKLANCKELEGISKTSFSSFVNYLRSTQSSEEGLFVRGEIVQKQIQDDWQMGLRTTESDYKDETLESLIFQKNNPFEIFEDVYESGPYFSQYKILVKLYELKEKKDLWNYFQNTIKSRCDDYERHSNDLAYISNQKLASCGSMSYFLKKNEINTYTDFINHLEGCYSLSTNIDVYKQCVNIDTKWINTMNRIMQLHSVRKQATKPYFFFKMFLPYLIFTLLVFYPLRYFFVLFKWLLKS